MHTYFFFQFQKKLKRNIQNVMLENVKVNKKNNTHNYESDY